MRPADRKKPRGSATRRRNGPARRDSPPAGQSFPHAGYRHIARNLLTLANQSPIAGREILRASIGALIGIALTGLISSWWGGAGFGAGVAPLLIPPMGASAVLLFGVPASPFAQPYAVIGGHLLAAIIGVTCTHWIPVPVLAAAVAVAGAIAAMALCRCVHPPSGAVALVAVLGGPHVLASGYGFVAVPVLLNTLLLIAAAIAYNRLTGRSYPHRAHAPPPPPASPRPASLTRADFEAVIADYGETLAIGADDLAMLFEDLQGRAERAGVAR